MYVQALPNFSKREELLRIKNNDCINKNISGLSAKERYNDNPEPYKENQQKLLPKQ